jgi:Trypsin-like peptidase domain
MEREEARIGSSPKDQFEVRSKDGKRVDPSSAIFPIIRQPNPPYGDVRVVGTGFYIGHHGLFATARHVLEECLDEKGKPTVSLSIVHRFPKTQTFTVRPIIHCFLHNGADIGVGMGAPMQCTETQEKLWANTLVLSSKPVASGDKVLTYAYPNATIKRSAADMHKAYFYPLFYQGIVTECYPSGRDRVMMPGPCFLTSIHLHGGASGGPVFDQFGRVCGINSTSFDGAPDVSFVSMIGGLLEIDIDHAVLDTEKGPERVRLARLIDLGHVPME